MAIFTSINKYFEVTAVSFSPDIITTGEETSYKITVKNVSGKKITSARLRMQLYYRDTAGMVRGSDPNDVYAGNLEYGFKSISWASGKSQTFTGKFVFVPLSSYPVNIDSRLLPLFKGSDAGYSEWYGGNARLGLMLNLTTNATFTDGGNSDAFFDLRGENSEYLYVIDARYKPTIFKFDAERSAGTKLNDEGENILASIALGKTDAAKPERMSLRLYYQDKAKPDSEVLSVDLTGLVNPALAAEVSTVVTEIFGKNFDWNLVLWFGDQYESTTASLLLSRSFANVHLSGASTGGVCFGSFSKATEGNPIFQCYYPSEFEAGIRGVTNYALGEVDTGGSWLNGERIYRYTWFGMVSITGAQEIVTKLPSVPGMVLSLRGMFKRSDGAWLPVPNTYRTDLEYSANIRTDADGNILVGLGSRYEGEKDLIIICEYTKREEVSS